MLKSHNHKQLKLYRRWREYLFYNDKKRQATYLLALSHTIRILEIDLKTPLCWEMFNPQHNRGFAVNEKLR